MEIIYDHAYFYCTTPTFVGSELTLVSLKAVLPGSARTRVIS